MPNCRVEYDSPVPGTHSHAPPMGWDDPEGRLQTHVASQHAVLRAYPIDSEPIDGGLDSMEEKEE